MAPQVLVFGLPRTGTQSILDALGILGYGKTYHMRNVEKEGNIDDWITLLDQKYDPSCDQKVDLHRLKRIVDEFDATADFPSAIFAAELIQLYLDAKVVLTPRDEDAWVQSMRTTLIRAHTSPDADHSRPMAPLADRYHKYCWKDDFAKYGRHFYRDYFVQVRSLVQGRELLEYNPGDGWEPLCGFLLKAVPDVGFPRSDELGHYRRRS